MTKEQGVEVRTRMQTVRAKMDAALMVLRAGRAEIGAIKELLDNRSLIEDCDEMLCHLDEAIDSTRVVEIIMDEWGELGRLLREGD